MKELCLSIWSISVMSNELILFETKDKEVKLNVPIDKDTVWLSQAQMTDLFKV